MRRNIGREELPTYGRGTGSQFHPQQIEVVLDPAISALHPRSLSTPSNISRNGGVCVHSCRSSQAFREQDSAQEALEKAKNLSVSGRVALSDCRDREAGIQAHLRERAKQERAAAVRVKEVRQSFWRLCCLFGIRLFFVLKHLDVYQSVNIDSLRCLATVAQPTCSRQQQLNPYC